MYNIKTIDHNDALFLAKKCLDIAKQNNFYISVSVVDASGNLLCQLRDVNAGLHTLSASYKKAFTAVSQKRNTSQIQDGIDKGFIPKEILSLDSRLTSMNGGVIIQNQDSIIGAIGVGGAHGKSDEDIAFKAMKVFFDS